MLAPHLLKYDHIEPHEFELLALKPSMREPLQDINTVPFSDPIDVHIYIYI